MKAIQFLISGQWAHFKKPETNNNPLTHDLITKTALLGLIGAVLGLDRQHMKVKYPQLSLDILYNVQLLQPVKKETWSFTLRKAVNFFEKAPKNMEFLKHPEFKVSLALKTKNSINEFDSFIESLKVGLSKYTPTLGLQNCPANLELLTIGEFSDKKYGAFTTKGFISKNSHKILSMDMTKIFRVGIDKIPTYQNDDFWNLPEFYYEIVYPDLFGEIEAEGEYYTLNNGECLWLI